MNYEKSIDSEDRSTTVINDNLDWGAIQYGHGVPPQKKSIRTGRVALFGAWLLTVAGGGAYLTTTLLSHENGDTAVLESTQLQSAKRVIVAAAEQDTLSDAQLTDIVNLVAKQVDEAVDAVVDSSVDLTESSHLGSRFGADSATALPDSTITATARSAITEESEQSNAIAPQQERVESIALQQDGVELTTLQQEPVDPALIVASSVTLNQSADQTIQSKPEAPIQQSVVSKAKKRVQLAAADETEVGVSTKKLPVIEAERFLVLAGTYTSSANALHIYYQLAEAGISSRLEMAQANRVIFHQVVVGPFASEEDARSTVELIRSRVGVLAEYIDTVSGSEPVTAEMPVSKPVAPVVTKAVQPKQEVNQKPRVQANALEKQKVRHAEPVAQMANSVTAPVVKQPKNAQDVSPAKLVANPVQSKLVTKPVREKVSAAKAPVAKQRVVSATESTSLKTTAIQEKPTVKRAVDGAKVTKSASVGLSKKSEKPIAASNKPPVGFPAIRTEYHVILAGSFSKLDNAKSIMVGLREKGVPAFLQSSKKRGLTHVKVGPFAYRHEADQGADWIHNNTKFQARPASLNWTRWAKDRDHILPLDNTIKTVQRPRNFPAPVAGHFLVLAGTYGAQSNAENVQKQLADSGISSRLQQEKQQGKSLTHVFVGPFDSRSEASQAGRIIEKQLGVSTRWLSAR
ncbi:MAG: SPOR domain-containing protein [Magnetococcales bacterium]|nr:SPOR domain-containing protein [Magnetococcales bacterium]